MAVAEATTCTLPQAGRGTFGVTGASSTPSKRRRMRGPSCPKSVLLGALAAVPLLDMPEAWAQAPRPWEIGLQPGFSPVKSQMISLNYLVTGLMTAIVALVAILILWVAFRYNARRHPIPSQTSHNTIIEILWTVIPVLILIVIAVPSFRLVYYEDRTRDADLTIKVTAHQWYWEYSYPDNGNIDFNSYVVPEDQLKPGQLRLLEVDNPLVVPAGKNVRILTTGTDVIHSFFIPSLGVQRYAIPGRTIETWVRVTQPGTYYGECNQICGTNHSQMPIKVVAIPADQFNNWLTQAKSKFSQSTPPKWGPPPNDQATVASR